MQKSQKLKVQRRSLGYLHSNTVYYLAHLKLNLKQNQTLILSIVNICPVSGQIFGSLTHSKCTTTPLGYRENWQLLKDFLHTTQ